jgi:toxin ParE1/3/4
VSSPTVRFRARAASDVEVAVDHYQREAGEAVAIDFIESLEQCVSRIRRSPRVGPLRYSYELDIPELRVLSAHRFPYLIFYVPHGDSVDIWRVLHSRRDIPSTLADDP